MDFTQFGLIPDSGKDMTGAFAKLFHYCKTNAVKSVSLPKGVYDFYEGEAFGVSLCPCGESSREEPKNLFALVLSEMDEFYLDGKGSTLKIHGNITAFLINSSVKVILNNFNIIFNKPQSFSVIETGKNFAIFHSPLAFEGGKALKSGGKVWNLPYGEVPMMTDGKAYLLNDPFKKVKLFCPFGKEYIRLKMKGKIKFTLGAAVPMGGDSACGIIIYNSQDISLANINIPSSPATGVYAEKVNRLDFYYIQLGDGRLGIDGKGIDCVSCSGKLIIRNCVLSGVGGDGICIRNEYTDVLDAQGARIIVPRKIGFPVCCGSFIDVYDGKSQTKLATTIVTGVKELEDSIELTTENVVSVRKGDKIIPGDYPKAEITANSIDRAAGYGMVVTACREAVIENNVIKGTAKAAVAFTGDEYNGGNIGSAVIKANEIRLVEAPQIYVKPFGGKKGTAFCKKLHMEGNRTDSKKCVKKVIVRVGEVTVQS